MTLATVTGASLCNTFVTAVLLTGSVTRAEAAILDGIAGQLIPKDSGELLERTLDAISRQNAVVGVDVPHAFPPELQRVLRLPPLLRRCFVLRVLMAWPPERCASFLRLDATIVDDAARIAAVQLAAN